MSEIEAVDLRAASDAEYAGIHAFHNRLRQERQPEDPPVPLAELVARYRSAPPFVRLAHWQVRGPAGTVLAMAGCDTLTTAENAHVAQMAVEVLPEQRRAGLGRALLGVVVAEAEALDRRLLIAHTSARIPAGAAFMARLGATKGLETHTNQLAVAELDRGLVARWLAAGAARAGEFELGLWEGPFPEGELAAIARLHDVMNDAPLGELELDDQRFTPEQLRDIEQAIFGSGATRWVMYVRERAGGRLAGFTVVTWHPNRPQLLAQGETGVFPEYRGRGLGRWLKAAMLDKVLLDRPEVAFVRTGNADMNEPMLRINHELGFRPHSAEAFWQLAVADARAYLDAGRAD